MTRHLLLAGLLGVMLTIHPAQADAARPLSNVSLLGSYGFRMTKFGTCPNISAVVGILTFDGTGNLEGGATAYQSNPGGAGVTVGGVTVEGTYAVNADGTGSLTADLIANGSTVDTIQWSFVIDNSRAQLELLDTGLNSVSCASSGVATKQ